MKVEYYNELDTLSDMIRTVPYVKLCFSLLSFDLSFLQLALNSNGLDET